jgi:ketosteroid isomerase-like protein
MHRYCPERRPGRLALTLVAALFSVAVQGATPAAPPAAPSSPAPSPAAAAAPTGAPAVPPAQVSTDGPAQLVAQQWARFWNAESIDALVALYAKDGEFFPTSGERIAGQAALRALFQAALSVNKPVITMTSVSSARSGNIAFDSGEYVEIITKKANGTAFPVTGRYLVVCRQGAGGHWQIAQQMWTEGPQKGK